MRLHLGGHLNWYDPQKRSWLELYLAEPTLLVELLRQLQVPTGEIALTVVNGRVVELEQTRVSDGDQVDLYPPIGGGSKGSAAHPILNKLKGAGHRSIGESKKVVEQVLADPSVFGRVFLSSLNWEH